LPEAALIMIIFLFFWISLVPLPHAVFGGDIILRVFHSCFFKIKNSPQVRQLSGGNLNKLAALAELA